MRGRLVVFALAFCVGLAGCTRVGTSAPGSGNPWTHKGLLRIADLADPDTLDPVVGNEQIDTDLAQFWGGLFFNYSDRDDYVPELATAVPTLANGGISRDGTTIVYHLRSGVLWQDGAPFTAADVVFTWHAIMNPRNNVGSRTGYELVRSIDVRDPHTIAVHLSHAYAPFVATFFAPSSESYPVLPAHLLEKYPDINRIPFNSAPVGTGPFIVEHWQRGSRIVFRANPHYWRGRPKLDEIWYTPVGDENTIVTLLASHDADLEFNGSSGNYKQLGGIEGYRTSLSPFNAYHQIAFNLRTPSLSDIRVRRALAYAFDANAAVTDLTHGVNVRAYTDQPSFGWAYNPNVAHYDYDPAKARALLDAAGWHPGPDGIRVKNGRRLSLVFATVSGSALGNGMAVFLQRNWRDAGVELEIKDYSTALFFESYGAGGIVQTGKFDVAFFSWYNGVDPDDSSQVMCDQIPPRGQNVDFYCDPRVDAAERVALASSDRATRKAAYATIQRDIADGVPFIVPWFVRRISVQNADLQNYRPAHAVTNWWNSYEWKI